MDYSSGQLLQLYIALGLGMGFFLAAFAVSEKTMMWILLLFIPFQAISTRYGTINEFMVLAVAAAFYLRGRLTQLPLGAAIGFIMLAYALSFTQAPPGTGTDQMLYVLAIIANFALFWMVYNFVLREGRWQTIFKILAAINALVLGYCAIQVGFGAQQFRLFGIVELTFNPNFGGGEQYSAQRVTGPFGATALAAEYFAIQIMIWAYFLIHAKEKRPRLLASVLIALNCAFMVATGNRGGIVTLAIGGLGYMFLFSKDLGLRRLVTLSVSGALLFAAMSVVVIDYTEFDSLYERLSDTEFEYGFIPDTRTGWVSLWGYIVEKPVFGHGPRMGVAGRASIGYPHNLFMYLFFTLGTVGTAAYAYFFVTLWRRYSRARRYRINDKMLSGMPRLGLLILVIFLVSQMRIELMRFNLHDYQQYFSMILAVFLAFSDRVRLRALQAQPVKKRRRQTVMQTAVYHRP